MAAFNTPRATSPASGLHHAVFPPHGASEADLLAFRDRVINPWSQYRNRRMQEIALWMSFYLGQQWVDIDPHAAFDGVRGALLSDSDLDMPDDMPRPVTNEIDLGIEQSVIALVQRKWTIAVDPTSSSDPAIKAAAQMATDIAQHRLDVLHWPEKRVQHAFHFALGGTGLIYSGVDRSYTKLRVVGAPGAMWCSSCSTKLYSADVPAAMMRNGIDGKPVAFGETAKPVPVAEQYDIDIMDQAQDLDLQRLNYCPTCSDKAVPLQPYHPTQAEAEGEEDVFGRSLGIAEPSDESCLEIDWPQEFYPQDSGYKKTPDNLRRWGRRKIRDIGWIEERAPHLMDKLNPDTVTELLYGDPIVGTGDMLGRWSGALDSGILDYHKNVDEVVELPSIRYPLGRYMVALKDEMIEEGDLMIPAVVESDDISEDTYVPRVSMGIGRCKLRPNEIWGSSIAAPAISPQKRLNGIDSQILDWRLGMGNAEVWMPEDMWVMNPQHIDRSQGGRKIHFYRPSPSMPEVTKPEVVGGLLMPDGVYQERDRVQGDIKRRLGPQDATIGEAPKNVGTTSGVQFLVDRDLATQSLREDELIRSTESAFSHLMRMEWLLKVDESTYKVKAADKSWSYKQYTGAAIKAQHNIKITRGSSIPHTTQQREAAREAIADKILPIETLSPVVRRELLELYGLDPGLAPDEFYQVDHAQRLWVDFRDKGIVRTQDTLDEPAIHYLVLRGHLRTEEGERLAESIGWDEINRTVAGWQDELRRMQELDAMAVEFYGGRLSPEEGQIAYGRALIAHDKQQAMFQKQSQTQTQMDPAAKATLGVLPAEPPQPPPPPVFLPPLLQDQVLLVWQKLLGQQGAQLPPPTIGAQFETGPDAGTFIRFRALVEAYRLSATPPAPTAGPTPGEGGEAPQENGGTSQPPPNTSTKNATNNGGSN